MIETMRFSEIPLWRRLLIVLVTVAVLGVVYWIVAAIVAVTPLWLDIVLAVGVIGFGVWAMGDDRRRAKRLALKSRRDR